MSEASEPAVLLLDDGRVFEGRGFGARTRAVGELVFNTSMSGYQEILTDPSYAGQLVTLTVPHVGNYGIHRADNESESIQATGLVVRSLSRQPSSWRAELSLHDWLVEAGVPGIYEVDTRAITRHIRSEGVRMAILAHPATENDVAELTAILAEAPRYDDVDWVEKVATSAPRQAVLRDDGAIGFGPVSASSAPRIVILDFGCKHSILRNLLERDVDVVLLPPTSSAEEVLAHDPAVVLVSNGPGDPARLAGTRETLRELPQQVPTWGICLGHQLLAKAFGAETYKLPFGHRGPNQPVDDSTASRVLITSQNHGYAVSPGSLPADLEVTQRNLNDGTIEAFRHANLPVFAVQYHPEAGPGPNDAVNFFDEICDLARRQE